MDIIILKKYDNLLKSKLDHLKKHSNYLPHIGKNFEQATRRILIVAESHYIAEKFNGLTSADNWYNNYDEIYKKLGSDSGWFNTREVLKSYFNQRNAGKIQGGLTIFSNLETAYKKVFNNVNLFDECVYINYFQRPSEKKGQSINVDIRDNQVAKDNLLTLIDVLKLDKIIFVSSKAYNNFIANTSISHRENLPYFGSVPHPSASAWWNRKSKKYGINGESITGRAKFERIIK